MAESGPSGSSSETAAADANTELVELKVKCGNYAEKCMSLMQDHQEKEAAWKEREKAMIKKLEDALKAIKLLKAKNEAKESQREMGETADSLQSKIHIASLQKQNASLNLEIKSIQSQLEMKSTLESKKSKLVELLDLKLSEKDKFIELIKLKLNQKDAKVALCEARIAQLEKFNCEMALKLEIGRQQLKKLGVEVGESWEIERARLRVLRKLEKGDEGQESGDNQSAAAASTIPPDPSDPGTTNAHSDAPKQESTGRPLETEEFPKETSPNTEKAMDSEKDKPPQTKEIADEANEKPGKCPPNKDAAQEQIAKYVDKNVSNNAHVESNVACDNELANVQPIETVQNGEPSSAPRESQSTTEALADQPKEPTQELAQSSDGASPKQEAATPADLGTSV